MASVCLRDETSSHTAAACSRLNAQYVVPKSRFWEEPTISISIHHHLELFCSKTKLSIQNKMSNKMSKRKFLAEMKFRKASTPSSANKQSGALSLSG